MGRFSSQGRSEDGDDGSSGGGRGSSLRRLFGGGGGRFNDWAFTLYRAGGITVRIHLLFVLLMVVQMIIGVAKGVALSTAMGLGGLFVLVLLHEYGHCLACRRVGGEADDILMWPLGGLASCRPPHTWRDELITVVGGPLVNVVLLPILGGAVLALGGGWGAVLFNPIDPFGTLSQSGFRNPGAAFIWWLHYANTGLLAFNVLLPMFPLDGGRIVQTLLWRKGTWRRSMTTASTLGLVCAIGVGVFGLLTAQGMLMGIALFAGLTCYQQKLSLASSDPSLDEESPFAESLRWREQPSGRGGHRVAVRRDEATKAQALQDAAELDRILAKIARDGMGALSRREKAFLSRETQRKRVE
ncbi:MAG: site-2 protease family protein [Phycisphaerales bacterium]